MSNPTVSWGATPGTTATAPTHSRLPFKLTGANAYLPQPTNTGASSVTPKSVLRQTAKVKESSAWGGFVVSQLTRIDSTIGFFSNLKLASVPGCLFLLGTAVRAGANKLRDGENSFNAQLANNFDFSGSVYYSFFATGIVAAGIFGLKMFTEAVLKSTFKTDLRLILNKMTDEQFNKFKISYEENRFKNIATDKFISAFNDEISTRQTNYFRQILTEAVKGHWKTEWTNCMPHAKPEKRRCLSIMLICKLLTAQEQILGQPLSGKLLLSIADNFWSKNKKDEKVHPFVENITQSLDWLLCKDYEDRVQIIQQLKTEILANDAPKKVEISNKNFTEIEAALQAAREVDSIRYFIRIGAEHFEGAPQSKGRFIAEFDPNKKDVADKKNQ